MRDNRNQDSQSKETISVVDGGRGLVHEIEELRGHIPVNVNQEEIER